MPQKQSALVLSLGGAPKTWHFLPDVVPGYYHPDIPVPLPDTLTAADAKTLDSDDGCPLKVVLVSEQKAGQGAEAQADAMRVGRKVAVAARRADETTPEEQERVQDEAAALSGGKEG